MKKKEAVQGKWKNSSRSGSGSRKAVLSFSRRLAVLEQQNHQTALERGQFAAVVLLQDGRQFEAEAQQAREGAAAWHV